jgi:dCMP deaminase
MQQAESIAQWSKDPRRKVGCLIVDSDNNQLSGGYNGFPRGIADDDRLNDRTTKLKMVVHAEANAVAAAARNGHSIKGATAYVNHCICPQCACLLIQAGVSRVVMTEQQGFSSEWHDAFRLARVLLLEANVVTEHIENWKK